MLPPLVTEVPRLAYVVAFGVAGVGCFATAVRARRIPDAEVRRGLTGLLVLSGLWSTAHVGRVVTTTEALGTAFYAVGLVPGLATVGAWLYFCSAYTGRAYHRVGWLRRVALGTFLAIVALKLTNPVHAAYYTTRVASEPFRHVVIVQGTLHWAVTALAYACSAVGFYMLFELYVDSNQDTKVLGGLVSLTAVPVLFNLVGYASPAVLDFNYEPLGVAVFALGVLYAAEESFLAVPRFGRQQIVDRLDDAVVIVDAAGEIRDYNETAARVFGSLSGADGASLDDVLPQVVKGLETDLPVEVTVDGHARYYQVSATPLTVGETDIGRGIICKDVTSLERQRQELQRQNTQLEGFAEAIDHELRNTLNAVTGYTTVAEQAVETNDPAGTKEALDRVTHNAERMTKVVSDLSVLARFGQTVQSVSGCRFEDVVRAAWDGHEDGPVELRVEGDATIRAERGRLETLFDTLFSFARANGAGRVWLTPTVEGFEYRDDGRPIPAGDVDRAFDYGEAVPDAESGMLLPTVRVLADVHDWTVETVPDAADGTALRVTGATVEPDR